MPLFSGWTDLYTRRLYGRIEDCWNRPIHGEAADTLQLCVRERSGWGDDAPLTLTGEKRRVLNLGSYNYLGFGGVDAHVTPRVREALAKYGVSACASRLESGDTAIHSQLERTVAAFLGKEAALAVGMGFATNSSVIPVLADESGDARGFFILSDALNH